MPVIVRTLLVAIAIPGVVALVVLLGGRRWRASPLVYAVAAPLAIVVSQLVGSWVTLGRPALVPADVNGWLLHVSALALALATAELMIASQRIRWLVRCSICLAIAYLLLRPLFGRWSIGEASLRLGAAAACLFAGQLIVGRVATGTTPRVAAAVMLMMVVTAVTGVAASGSATVGQLAGAAAAGMGALWFVTLVRPAPLASVAPVAATIAWSMIVVGVFYAAMPVDVAVAIALMPVSALVVHELTTLRHTRHAAVAVVVVALLASLVSLAVTARSATQATDEEYGYE